MVSYYKHIQSILFLGTITLNRKEWVREERARERKKDGRGGSMEAAWGPFPLNDQPMSPTFTKLPRYDN